MNNPQYDEVTNTFIESDEQQQFRLNIRLRESDYPQLYDNLELRDFPRNLDTIRKFFTLEHNRDHLVIAGKEAEKNLLAFAIVKRYLKNYPDRTVKIKSFAELYLLLNQSWSNAEELSRIEELKQVDLFCLLDCELPINRDNNNTLKLIELLQYRQNYKKMMLITTSLLKKDLVDYYRLYDPAFLNLVFKP